MRLAFLRLNRLTAGLGTSRVDDCLFIRVFRGQNIPVKTSA